MHCDHEWNLEMTAQKRRGVAAGQGTVSMNHINGGPSVQLFSWCSQPHKET